MSSHSIKSKARSKKNNTAIRLSRVALQFGWRKVIGGKDRPSVRASFDGLRRHLNVDGNESDVAKAAFAAGLISRRRMRGVLGDDAMDALVGMSQPKADTVISWGKVSEFYKSKEWRQLAYKCKLRDGRRCMCCGATPDSGARIVSDHVMPLRTHWHLRLDPMNIQTLCDECNLGKGSWDQTRFVEVSA